MKLINKGLELFRVKHGLENDEGNLLANINDEITELLRAKCDHEVVGELCDIYIFAHNCIHQNAYTTCHDFKKAVNCRSFNNITREEMASRFWYSLAGAVIDDISKIDGLNEVCADVILILCCMGYDAEKCVLEKIKVINSRTGEIDLRINKWVKHTTAKAKANWYVADFAGCML